MPTVQISEEIANWHESLKRPDIEAARAHGEDVAAEISSCCGVGDAYNINILEEAWPPHTGTEENGLAVVTDPGAKNILIPDGRDALGRIQYRSKYRYPIAPGQERFKFSGNKLTRELEGNPLKTAIAFLRVQSSGEANPGSITMVWCVVPLPPSF